VQHLAIRYTDRLADIGAVGSVGSVGDSFDNAAVESLVGLFKTDPRTACPRLLGHSQPRGLTRVTGDSRIRPT
jgi:hypothetical protein